MSAELTGPQPQTRNENNNQANGNGNAVRGSSPEAAHPSQQHLTPDRPPHFEGGEGKQRRPRGFAAMDRKVVSEIARKGGKAAHSAGTAHEFTSEEARVAGRKGGRATHAKRRQGDEPSVESVGDETGGE